MVVMRSLAAAATVVLLSAVGAGCGGLSESDAKVRCEQDQQALGYFFDDKVMAACMSCFEDCGDSCVRHSTAPLTYTCPGDEGTGGTSQ
jgi:hypothetical protein